MATSDQLAQARTDMAATRTALAAERTLMAWIRTALGMISFGFTIYKFLHVLTEASEIHLRRPGSARNLGIFLTALGTSSLVAGIGQYVQTIRRIDNYAHRGLGFTFYIGCGVVILGLAVLLGIVIRIGPFN